MSQVAGAKGKAPPVAEPHEEEDIGATMLPLKLCISYDPPRIAVVYHKSQDDPNVYGYSILLNKLIFMGDALQITKELYEIHGDFLSPMRINPVQVSEDSNSGVQARGKDPLLSRTATDGINDLE